MIKDVNFLYVLIIVLAVLITLLMLLAVIVLAYLLFFVRPAKSREVKGALARDYAHRGLYRDGVPENSLTAFELAAERGFGIELDVQLSKDGKVMVFHDYDLSRMCGCEKKFCELTAEELAELSLGETDQKIPTFEQVLKLIDGRVPLLVELKGEDLNVSLCEKVADILSEYNGEYCIESFNPLLVREIKKHLPDAFVGLLYTNTCRKSYSPINILLALMAFNFLARPHFIAYNKDDRNSLPVKLVAGLFGAPRFVWTVKSEEEFVLAHELGELPIFEKIESLY